MLNFIWGGMILIGILYAAFHGTMPEVGEAALTSARDAVNLCITMLGVMGLWLGLMEVARASGIMERLTKRLQPALHFLFPNIPARHPSLEAIGINLIANLLGLGWAATPAGLKAMEELSELEKERKNPEYLTEGNRRASNEMCTFLVLNISSLQLIPVNVIAYRSQYGSASPTAVIAPAIAATLFSTVVAVAYCKIMGAKTCRSTKKL
ncbi:MAG: nucleoside recognition protein [Lachnospiraceae bacterium]|nr:nucleoside recognition protein [Lachnospiraceae bacterium]